MARIRLFTAAFFTSLAATAGVLTLSGIAVAQDATSFVECRAIDAEDQRLACYDRLADALIGVPEDTRAEAIAAQPSAADLVRLSKEDMLAQKIEEEKQNFGADRLKAEDREAPLVDSLTQNVTGFRVMAGGEIRLTLANGQVWQQLSSDRTTFIRPEADDFRTATIEKGFMGSYRLKVEPVGKSMKVTRIQ